MYQPPQRCFANARRLCCIAALLGAVNALSLVDAAWADVHEQGSLPPCPIQTTLFFSPSPAYEQDSVLFLSTVHPGTVWRSDDAGLTWSNLVDMSRYDGFVFGPVTVVPAALNNGFHLYHDWTVLSNFSVTARLLWYSDDSGATWQARDPSPGEALNSMYPTDDPNVMFALA